MNVGEYLFRRLEELGVGHLFGIPGDFVVPHFRVAADVGLQIVVTTHEPGAGFAADAYARLAGLGAVLTTYGAGALNMVNAIAQAYAEKSPVLVVSGAPEVQGRRIDALFHHRVKGYDSQLNVYREITGAAALARALGGRGTRVATRGELWAALKDAERSREFSVIDAVLDPADVSPTWRRITEGIQRRMTSPPRSH